MIKTAKVTDRRNLHFQSPDELFRDVDAVEAADRRGTLRRSGNWSAGQTFGHLAAWIDFAYDGHPSELDPPWFIRFILRMMKKRFLRGPLKAGVRIPRIKGGTLATDPLPLDEGLARFRRAWARLRERPPTEPNVIFGPMTHAEWITIHLRHAELHLSFLHPE